MNVHLMPPVPITAGSDRAEGKGGATCTTSARQRFVVLNRIRSAILQMKLFQNELVYVGIELKSGSITPDEAEALLEQMGASDLIKSVVGLQ